MEIAIITKKNPDFHGGIEVFISMLVEALAERGHNVSIFTLDSIKKIPFPYSYIKRVMERTPYNVIIDAYLLALLAIKSGKKFDVVLSNEYGIFAEGKKKIVMQHGYYKDFFNSIKHKISTLYYLWGMELARVQRLALKKADVIITPSAHTALGLAKDNFKVDYIIPHGIDRKIYHPITNPREYLAGLNLPDNFLLFVGFSAPWKNFEMIEKISEYYKIVCVTKGVSRSDNLIFIGNVDRGLMPALYNSADLLVHPAFHESFSYAVAEAMSCGTPAIFTMTGYGPDIYKEIPEIIVQDPRNYKEFKERIAYALRNREHLSRRCIDFIEKNNDIEKWKEQWINIVES